jgi:hypothetical protein
MTLEISKFGSKVKVVINGDDDAYYFDQSSVDLSYNSTSNTISFTGKGFNYPPIPIANVTIGGVVITSQSVFETQVAAVFLKANSGTGGTASTAPEATAYFTRFAAAGGTLTPTHQAAINTCINTLKANELYRNIVEMGLMHGGSAATNALGFKNAHNLIFNNTWVHDATGSKGTLASNPYARTGIIPSDELSLNNMALTVGLAEDSTNGGDVLSASTSASQICRINISGTPSIVADFGASTERVSGTLTTSIGLLTVSRTSISRVDIYQNAVNKGFLTTTQTGALPNYELYLNALNTIGTPANASDKKINFWCVASGRTAAEETIFINAIQTCLTALGK